MHNMDADMLDTLSTDYDLPLDSEHVPVHHSSGLAWLQTSWLKRTRRGDDAEERQPMTKVTNGAESVPLDRALRLRRAAYQPLASL